MQRKAGKELCMSLSNIWSVGDFVCFRFIRLSRTASHDYLLALSCQHGISSNSNPGRMALRLDLQGKSSEYTGFATVKHLKIHVSVFQMQVMDSCIYSF